MHPQVHLPSQDIKSLVDQILSLRRMTRTDQQRLMSVLLSKTALSREDNALINRVFDHLRAGLIRIVD